MAGYCQRPTATNPEKVAEINRLIEESHSASHNNQGGEAMRLILKAMAYEPELPETSAARVSLLGRFASKLQDYGALQLAIGYAILAVRTEEQSGRPPDRMLCYEYGRLGGMYMESGNLDSAYFYFERGLHHAHQFNDSLFVAGAINNMGMAREQQGRFENALALYRSALSITPPLQDGSPQLASSIRDNIASCLRKDGQLAAALKEYTENLAYFNSNLNRSKYVYILYQMAQLQAELGQGQQSLKTQVEADRWLATVPKLPDLVRQQFLTRIRREEIAGNWREVARHQKQYLAYTDSLGTANNDLMSGTQERLAEISLGRIGNELEVERLERNRIDQRTTIVVLGAALAVLAAAVLFYILRMNYRRRIKLGEARRRLAQQELERQRQDAQGLSTTLKMKEKDIEELAMYFLNNRQLVEKLMDELEAISRTQPGNIGQRARSITQNLRPQVQVDEKLATVYSSPEDVNNAFFARLKGLHPTLTLTDLELSVLVRMRLTNAEIASLRNISPTSAKMARYRLAKKLGLEQGSQIEEYLQGI